MTETSWTTSPVDILAVAYCEAEHGGHSSGPLCDFGRNRARRILNSLPHDWRLTNDADVVNTDAVREAVNPWRQALQTAVVLAHVDGRHGTTFNVCTHPVCAEARSLMAPTTAIDPDSSADQRPGGYVSRRPE